MPLPAGVGREETAGELVARARAGEREAWNALVRRYTRMLLGIARAFGLDEESARDVAQVTWLQLAQQLDEIRAPDAVGGWLATIARRESLRVKRLRGREQPVEAERFESEPSPESVEVRVLTDDRDRSVRRAFDLLGARCKQLLRLLLADVPYSEISLALEMPVGSIGPTRQRCLATLRERLSEAAVED